MKDFQKIATKVFVTASLLFGLTGIITILVSPDGDPTVVAAIRTKLAARNK